MPSCCGGSVECGCKVSAGPGVEITGSGTSSDPFVISASINFQVQDNTTFDLTLIGDGSAGSPYRLSVNYASTAKLDDLPDVAVGAASPGQVLGFDGTSWVPVAATTAPTGAVQHNASLTGDGSGGNPLAVSFQGGRFIGLISTGIGINDAGVNQMVRQFTDLTTANAANNPVPTLNTLALVGTDPGRIYYWNGTVFVPSRPAFDTVLVGGEFMALSGTWDTISVLTHYMKTLTVNTDGAGSFDVLTPADLSGRAGVLTCMVQEVGTVGFKVLIRTNTDRVSGTAFWQTDGTPYASQSITVLVDSWLY